MSVGRTIETLGKHTAFAKITEESFCDVLMDDGKARINNFKDKEWPSLPVDEIVKRAQNAVGKKDTMFLVTTVSTLQLDADMEIA
ncbi:unnamed protein product [Rotaria sp. Silwood1]|nr:unnamed protein product [Rotaria sp. Silwood1]